ncbi:mucin-5AC isoform X2 [Ceratitis capitata]|nr:mucin-5AC isoform X2 [Ceratitis capitata]
MLHARQQAPSDQLTRYKKMSNSKRRYSRLRLNSLAMLICLLCSGLASTNADCQKDGINYMNGDKLVDPETPCTVCYCQGGEILCSSVTCFQRDDCKPKYIPGRCCPEYHNCPVSIFDPSHNVNQSNNLPSPVAEANAVTSPTTQTAAPVIVAQPNITIKEITKPIEIRITDDNKAIPIHQMLKPQTTAATTTTTATTASEQTSTTAAFVATGDISTTQTPAAAAATNPTNPTNIEHNDNNNNNNNSGELTNTNIKVTSNESFTTDNNRQILLPVAGDVNSVESLKLSASVAYPSTERNTVTAILTPNGASVENSSEVSAEVSQLIEDGSGIPAFGAQELQHEAISSDPTKVNIKRENLATTERTTGSVVGEEYGSSELLDGNSNVQNGGLLTQGTFDLEPETAGSDNIYHIILTTSGPRVDESTDAFAGFHITEDLQNPVDVEIQAEASNPQHSVILPPPQLLNFTKSPIDLRNTTKSTTTAPVKPTVSTDAPELTSVSTESAKHTSDSAHHIEDEETAIPMEANPAYPSLPEDDFSLRDVNFPLNEADDAFEADSKDEQRSIGVSAFDAARPRRPTEEGSGSGAELIMSSSTAGYEAEQTSESATKVTTKVALLMNSAEDLSAETAISNSSDFQLDRLSRLANNYSNTDSTESQEDQLSSELGSGSGESTEMVKKINKRREPTTPRPTPHAAVQVDIDELGDNASGDGKSDPADDPKLDAESIKADENVEEGIVKQEGGHKEDVLTVNTKPAEEHAVEELPVAQAFGSIQRTLLRFL